MKLFQLAEESEKVILPIMQTKTDILESGFIDARIHLLELAAFLDRVDRAEGVADERLAHMQRIIALLCKEDAHADRVVGVLNALSHVGESPVTSPVGKSACGAPL